GRHELARRQVARRAEDDDGARRCHARGVDVDQRVFTRDVLKTHWVAAASGPALSSAGPACSRAASAPADSSNSLCPPNSLRRAAMMRAAKLSVRRELKRSYSAMVRTGAGTARLTASSTVHLPSPESST